MATDTRSRRGVRVVYGANVLQDLELVGASVLDAKRKYARPFNMPGSTIVSDGVTSLTNGVKVSDTYTLKEGDHLEFVKLAGRKG